jgi:dolichol-phosphate mannosyltransferase
MYNEEKTAELMVKGLVSKLASSKIKYEILAVDDGSTDRTSDRLKKIRKSVRQLRIVTHKTNMGLGAALNTGFKSAKSDIIVTMDADLTQDPAHIEAMLDEIKNGYDMVIGSRYVRGGGMEGVPVHRVLVSRLANLAFSVIFMTAIMDMSSGFRCYKKSLVKDIEVENKGFPSQLEILVKCLRKKPKVKEIPFVLVSRSIGESKFDIVSDAKKYVSAILGIMSESLQ